MSEPSRRTFLSGGAACAAALGLDIRRGFTQGAGRPNLHAMIVGINAYTGRVGSGNRGSANPVFRAIKPLRGCLNDARTIEQAIKTCGHGIAPCGKDNLSARAWLPIMRGLSAKMEADHEYSR